MERSQLSLIAKDLRQKLVFLTGPRQVEKTHLALDPLKKSTNGAYLNYDNLEELGSASLSANQEKKEVDFALAVEDQPSTIIEAKLSESDREVQPAGPREHLKGTRHVCVGGGYEPLMHCVPQGLGSES